MYYSVLQGFINATIREMGLKLVLAVPIQKNYILAKTLSQTLKIHSGFIMNNLYQFLPFINNNDKVSSANRNILSFNLDNYDVMYKK